jgi:hypothetical protein
VLPFPLFKYFLLTALRMSFSLRLQKEVLFKPKPQLRLSLSSKFFLYLYSNGRWGGLGYVPTPLGRKLGKRERRKSSVSHVASSTEW